MRQHRVTTWVDFFRDKRQHDAGPCQRWQAQGYDETGKHTLRRTETSLSTTGAAGENPAAWLGSAGILLYLPDLDSFVRSAPYRPCPRPGRLTERSCTGQPDGP